jgi:hypothetical protein
MIPSEIVLYLHCNLPFYQRGTNPVKTFFYFLFLCALDYHPGSAPRIRTVPYRKLKNLIDTGTVSLLIYFYSPTNMRCHL